MLLNTENIALRSFVYICISREKLAFLRQSQLKNGSLVRAYYKYIQNLQTLQGYIFRILQPISPANFAIFLILRRSKRYRSSCPVRPLVYNREVQI